MAKPTVAAGYPKALLEFAVARGADRHSLLERSGLRVDDLQDQDNRVPLGAYLALQVASVELCNEPALALLFGETVSMPEITILGLIGGAAESIGEARLQINRYTKLALDEGDAGTSGCLDILRNADGVWLELTGRFYVDSRFSTEATFARSICGARALLGHTAYFKNHGFPRAIHFTHPEPRYRAEYDRIFNVPLTFASDKNAMLIDEQFLSIKLPGNNRYVFGVLSERAEALLKKLEGSKSIRGQVESALIPLLHTGAANAESIAAKLGFSRHTLFRKLKAEGVTFQKLLDELRHKMALYYLDSKKVSVNETAYLVGFSEPAAFSRAFKRWTGFSPRGKSIARL